MTWPGLWGWLPHVLVAALAIPFILHQNVWFEWGNALWLLELQTAHVSSYGIPTFFTHAAGEYFYPEQLFYAGPVLAVLSYPSVLFGAWAVFATVTAAAFTAASAGISWAARNLGVHPRLAVVPGVLFAVTPYVVSDLYGRGDWAELVAIGALAVAIGAATALLTARGNTPGLMVTLALAVSTIAGVHNLTLLFSSLVSPLIAVSVLPLLPGPRAQVWRRYGLVVLAAILGLAVVGVFLVPNIWLSARTITGHYSYGFLTKVTGFDRPSILLDPLPGQPAGSAASDVHTQTLVLPLVWVLLVGGVSVARSRIGRPSRISLLLLLFGIVALVLVISHPRWWLGLPHYLTAIQFTFRLVTYVALLTVLAVAVLLAVPAVRTSRVAIVALLIACVWQIGAAGYLALSANARGSRSPPTAGSVRADVKPSGFQTGQRIQFRLHFPSALPTPRAEASVVPIGDDSPPQVHLYGRQRVGSLVATRVVGSPLIRLSGDVTVVGHTLYGLDIVRVNRSPWQATVSAVCNTCIGAIAGRSPVALLAGRVLSVVGLLILLVLVVRTVRDRRRRAGAPALSRQPGEELIVDSPELGQI